MVLPVPIILLEYQIIFWLVSFHSRNSKTFCGGVVENALLLGRIENARFYTWYLFVILCNVIFDIMTTLGEKSSFHLLERWWKIWESKEMWHFYIFQDYKKSDISMNWEVENVAISTFLTEKKMAEWKLQTGVQIKFPDFIFFSSPISFSFHLPWQQTHMDTLTCKYHFENTSLAASTTVDIVVVMANSIYRFWCKFRKHLLIETHLSLIGPFLHTLFGIMVIFNTNFRLQ